MNTGTAFLKNDDRIEIVHRIYSPEPNHYVLVVGVLVPFALQGQDNPVNLPAEPLWTVINRSLAEDIFDEGWPKPKGEFLVAGYGYPPKNHTEQPVSVRVSVGQVQKQLALFGQRYATALGGLSDPAPIQPTLLSLKNAFGGPGYAANPLGLGHPSAHSEPSPDSANNTARLAMPTIELPQALMLKASDCPPPACMGPLAASFPQRSRYLGDMGTRWQKERWPHLPLDSQADYFMAGASDQWHTDYWTPGTHIRVMNMHPDDPVLTGYSPTQLVQLQVRARNTQGQLIDSTFDTHTDTLWLLPNERLGIAIQRASVRVSEPNGADILAVMACLHEADAMVSAHDIQQTLDNAVRTVPGPAPYVPPSPPAAYHTRSTTHHDLAAQRRQYVIERMSQGLSCAGLDLEYANLAGLELNHVDFTGAMLAGANFAGAQLTHVILSHAFMPSACLDGVQLEHCQLTSASLHETSLRGTRFTHCDLQLTDFSSAVLQDTHFEDSQLNQTILSQTWMPHTTLIRCQVQSAQWDHAELSDLRLQDCILDGVNLTGSRMCRSYAQNTSFKQANFSFCDASASRWDGCDLQSSQASQGSCFTQASLTLAHMAQISWMGADISHARMNKVMADQADFSNSSLSGTDMTGASLKMTCFDHANLTGAKMEHCNMLQASFIGTRLNDAHLNFSNLYGATFVDTIFAGVQINDTLLDNTHLALRLSA